jgi:hypothetical protein
MHPQQPQPRSNGVLQQQQPPQTVPPEQPEVVQKAAQAIQRAQAAQRTQPGQATQRDVKARPERHQPNRPEQKQAKPPQTVPQTDKAGPQHPKAERDGKPTRKEEHKKCPDGQKDC